MFQVSPLFSSSPSSFDGYPIFSVMPSCQIPALRVMGSFCPSLKPMVSPSRRVTSYSST